MAGSIAIQSAVIIGTLKPAASISGSVAIAVGYDNYSGDYDITPEVDSKTIETKDKLMSDDLVVKAIPFYEVANPQGGTTIIIGGK